jgi:hypothetical protein
MVLDNVVDIVVDSVVSDVIRNFRGLMGLMGAHGPGPEV